jgi:hypothetical protein
MNEIANSDGVRRPRKIVGHAYCVLSVRDLRQMLKGAAARAKAQKLSGRQLGNHCVVFENIEIIDMSEPDGRFQLDGHTMVLHARKLAEMYKHRA